jgi:hypothetical protein
VKLEGTTSVMIQHMAIVSCARCGVSAAGDDPPMEWVSSVDAGRTQYFCGQCARDSLLAIEARLDPAWW